MDERAYRFIRDALSYGQSEEDIRRELIEGGLPEQEIEAAIRQVKTELAPKASPGPATPASTVPKPEALAQGASKSRDDTKPGANATPPEASKKPAGRGKYLYAAIGLLLVVAVFVALPNLPMVKVGETQTTTTMEEAPDDTDYQEASTTTVKRPVKTTVKKTTTTATAKTATTAGATTTTVKSNETSKSKTTTTLKSRGDNTPTAGGKCETICKYRGLSPSCKKSENYCKQLMGAPIMTVQGECKEATDICCCLRG